MTLKKNFFGRFRMFVYKTCSNSIVLRFELVQLKSEPMSVVAENKFKYTIKLISFCPFRSSSK